MISVRRELMKLNRRLQGIPELPAPAAAPALQVMTSPAAAAAAGGIVMSQSDGLTPPLNAPPAGQVVTGVQPGVSNAVVLANQVIVFGPSGSVSGVFVYQPGTTPGPGNPPLLALSGSATDPFGNSIRPGDSSAAPSLIVLAPSSAAFVELFASGSQAEVALSTGDASESVPASLNTSVAGAGTTRSLTSFLQSPTLPGLGTAMLQGSTGTADGVTQGAFTILSTTDSGALIYVGSQNGNPANPTIVTNGGIFQANNAGIQPARISRTPLTLVNGFGTVAGELVPSVFLDPLNQGQLVFAGRMTVPAAPNAIDFAVLPTAVLFSPNTPFSLPTTSRRAPISYLGGTALAGSPRLFVTSTGHLQLSSIPAGGAGNDVDLGGAVIRLA